MTDITSIPILPIYGTFSGDFEVTDEACTDPGHWWHRSSKWWEYMTGLGFEPFRSDDFVWTGELEGFGVSIRQLWNWVRRKPADHTHRHPQWFAGGQALDDYISDGIYKGRDAEAFVTIAHSHGGQVALYAAASGREIPLLITVSTPHRLDMQVVTAKARPQIGFWVHLYDPDRDDIGQAGAFTDGGISFDRKQPKADVNIALKGCSHSLALSDPARYHVWKDAILPSIDPLLATWRAPDLKPAG